MDLSELVDRFDDRLRTADFADIDTSANGLQVGTDREIAHAAFAVDAVLETIERAVDARADILVTHHGLVWDGLERVTGRQYRRIAPLIEEDLALYVSHLPLDAHPELGNAGRIADILGLEGRQPFGELGPEHIGQRGRLPEPTTAGELASVLQDELDTAGRDIRILDSGPDRIESVAVLTGAGGDWLDEANAVGADAFVTGEARHRIYHEAREVGITVLLAGHYATETGGVRALQDLADDWGLETTFLDVPTGL